MKYNKHNLDKIIECLEKGGVICFPTETVYALSCDANNQAAINKIYAIKQRSLTKPLAVLISDIECARNYVEINSVAAKIIDQYSPGPISYVLPIKENARIDKTIIKNSTLAIRIPNHKVAQEILRGYGKPLVGTSVNISSQESAINFKDIPEDMKRNIDIILEDDNSIVSGVSSTILDLSSGTKRVLREGEIDFKKNESS